MAEKNLPPQISNLVFKELIKRGYSLEGKKRVWNISDSKLGYLTEKQAKAFLKLTKTERYQKGNMSREVALLKKKMKEISLTVSSKKINLVDLGCGDGSKAALFLKNLKGVEKVRYCPVDINSFMVKNAVKKIKSLKVHEVIEADWNISDFDNLDNVVRAVSNPEYKKSVFLFLGDALGNSEVNEILHNIRRAMKDKDLLIIGSALNSKDEKKILSFYEGKQIKNFMSLIPLQAGIKPKEVSFGARLNNSRVELYFELKKDKQIYFQEKTISFKKGDKIIVAVSYKHSEKNLSTLLHMYFDNVQVYLDEKNFYALAVCKK